MTPIDYIILGAIVVAHVAREYMHRKTARKAQYATQ